MEDRSAGLSKAAFICPYCKAYTQQEWFDLYARIRENPAHAYDPDLIKSLMKEEEDRTGEKSPTWVELLTVVEQNFPGIASQYSSTGVTSVRNAHISRCFVCKKEAVWVGECLAYPEHNLEIPDSNIDLSADVARDYREAGAVLSASPRAAAALLRLAIQKLCAELLGEHSRIDEMIAKLVEKGLSVKVQQALDVVRVVGNEAVHPGAMDLRDDHATALRLFALVNIIADAMISQPKHIQELYASLPPSKIEAIDRRDKKQSRSETGQ